MALPISNRAMGRFWCPLMAKIYFVVCNAFHSLNNKKSDWAIKLHRIQVSWKTDSSKYPIVINLLRHEHIHFRYQMICTCF